MKKLLSGSRIAILVGVVSSLLFLAVALNNVAWSSIIQAFVTVDYVSLALSSGALFLGIFLRAARWRLISGLPDFKQGKFFRATTSGFFFNLVLPGRAGDVLRILALSRVCSTSLTKSLASALIDRMADVVALVFATWLLYFLLPINNLIKELLSSVILTGLILSAGVLFYLQAAKSLELLFVRLISRWLQNWSVKIEVFMAEFRLELKNIIAGWISFELILLLLVTLLSDYWALLELLLAFNLALPLPAPLMLWVFFALGSALPAAPGYVGVYQVAAVLALSFFEVSASISVAVATMFQLINLSLASMMMLGLKVFVGR